MSNHSFPGSSAPTSTLSTLSLRSYGLLILQHLSSSLSEQCLEFASPLILITIFPDTLLPASILGLGMTLSTLFLSSKVGAMIDDAKGGRRLSFARYAVVVQKVSEVRAIQAVWNHPCAQVRPATLSILSTAGSKPCIHGATSAVRYRGGP